MYRLLIYFVLTVLVSHDGFATNDDCCVRPRAMPEYPRRLESWLRTGAIHWLGGIQVGGPRCVTREDGERTAVTIIVTRTNVTDSTIVSCGVFSFTAVAQYNAAAIPCKIARAVIPNDHDCKLIHIEPWETVQDSLVFSCDSVGAEEHRGVIDFRCIYYELSPEKYWYGSGELDLGTVLVPFTHAN